MSRKPYPYVRMVWQCAISDDHTKDEPALRKVLRKLCREAVREYIRMYEPLACIVSHAREDRIARELVPGPSQKRGRK